MTTSSHRLSVLPYMEQRFKKVARAHGFKAKTRPAWQSWRRKTVARLAELTGYDTMQTSPLRPVVTETVQCDGYTRQRMEIQTEPGVIMPFYVLKPDGMTRSERRPAVLCPHGHGSGGKYSPAGVAVDEDVAKAIAHYNYDYGVQYVKRGLMVFCSDARGFGERQEPTIHGATKRQPLTASSCQFINQMAYPLGQTVTGMWAWDLRRLIDYAQSRPDVDADRIGSAGLSGGGLQTLWASVFDDRIKAAVISGYFYGYRQSLLQKHQNCSCNYVPHLYETVDMGDLGALLAPRPVLIETGDADPLNGKDGLRNVKSQVAIARRAYQVAGVPKSLVHVVFEGEHKWHGVRAVPWMVERLGE